MSDVFVRTSTRKKDVALDVELAGVKQAGQVHFVADMLDEKGEVEKSFNGGRGGGGQGYRRRSLSPGPGRTRACGTWTSPIFTRCG